MLNTDFPNIPNVDEERLQSIRVIREIRVQSKYSAWEYEWATCLCLPFRAMAIIKNVFSVPTYFVFHVSFCTFAPCNISSCI